MKIADDITKLIGNTPMVRINKFKETENCNIYAKLEYYNPLSSIKDRIALAMIEDAERSGLLKKGTVIIEPTSGNTGIGLAFISVVKEYKLILTMPESMSMERRKLLKTLGAEVILTPSAEGMKGAIKKAEELVLKTPDSFMPSQFSNPANPEIHKRTTAEEIWKDTEGQVDAVIAGVGTGGTITGIGEALKNKNPDIKIIAVEPETSAVLSGDSPGPHKIQGIGAGFIPEALNTQIYDEIIKVKDEDAAKTTRILAKKEGLLTGISSGAAMWAALEVAKRKEYLNKNIVVIFPDTGERYLSTWLFD